MSSSEVHVRSTGPVIIVFSVCVSSESSQPAVKYALIAFLEQSYTTQMAYNLTN